jgi:tryptophan synthase beta chain
MELKNDSAVEERPADFYGDLEKLFRDQLERKPDLHTVRLKLLELYYEIQRKDDFLREARTLRPQLRDPKAPEWQKCLSMGRMLDPTEPFYQEASDTIAFVGTGSAPPPAPADKKRRFGEDKHRTRHFEALAADYEKLRASPHFLTQLDRELMHVARRPTPLMHLRRLSESGGGAQIHLKRDDMAPDDTQLIISVIGQALLARHLDRKTLVTTSVNGRRGVITASVAAHLGMKAVVFMDADDIHRQSSNVFRLWLLGADVQSVDAKALRNRDVREAALDHWTRNVKDSFLVVGLDAAPHPYPMMVREFTTAVGRECRRQCLALLKRLPDLVVARGQGADALGLFPAFLGDAGVRLACIDPSKPIPVQRQDRNPFDPTQIPLSGAEQTRATSILEGHGYPNVTREHAWLRESGRIEYHRISQEAAKRAISDLSHKEGLIPALETAHALAWASETARSMKPEQAIVVMVAEDVEKDLWDIGRLMGVPF